MRRKVGDRDGVRNRGTLEGGNRAAHSFHRGDRVYIYRLRLFERPFIEGRATILQPITGVRDFYRVRFDGERRERERLAHPGDWQSNPEKLLAELHAEWLQSLTPELIAEFFPDDMRETEGGS